MRNGTKKGKKIAPIICAAVVIGLLGIYLGVVLVPLLGASFDGLLVAGILALYALIILAVIGGILLALRQRLREIEGGEEEDAKKY